MLTGRRAPSLVLLLAVTLTGCEQARALVDGMSSPGTAAASASGSAPAPAAGEQATPTTWAIPPLTAGSFSRLRVTKQGQPNGEQSVKVLSVSGDQARVEIEANLTSSPRTIVNALVRVGDRRLPSSFDILDAQLKTGGAPVMRVSGAAVKGAQNALFKQLDVFAYPDPAQEPRREDVTVPAGTFRGCMVVDREATLQVPMIGRVVTRTRTWYHPSVVTNGIVRQEVDSNGEKQLYELVATAASGATSAL